MDVGIYMYFSDLLFSHSIMPDSLQPHGLQHARLPCPSLSPGACSNSSSLVILIIYVTIISTNYSKNSQGMTPFLFLHIFSLVPSSRIKKTSPRNQEKIVTKKVSVKSYLEITSLGYFFFEWRTFVLLKTK